MGYGPLQGGYRVSHFFVYIQKDKGEILKLTPKALREMVFDNPKSVAYIDKYLSLPEKK